MSVGSGWKAAAKAVLHELAESTGTAGNLPAGAKRWRLKCACWLGVSVTSCWRPYTVFQLLIGLLW